LGFKIIRSQRKSIGITVKDNEVVVRAPHYLSDAEIKLELKEHQLWINEKLRQHETRQSMADNFRESGKFLLLGRELAVSLTEGRKISVYGKEILIGRESNIDRFLKKEFSNIIEDMVLGWGHINKPTSITYRKQRTIWGSCTSKGKINLNINLVKAPIEVIEYIYIHELVHLEIRNHSKVFWNRVETLLPNYRLAKKWLKDNGHLIGMDFMIK
jgi:predicted metal-dependent hydrolase